MAIQLITPNPKISCKPGMCLEYVRETFGVAPKYPSAIADWEASALKHTNQDFPAGVWVPVWFTLSDNPAGHVALRQPDGSIWSSSSPTDTAPMHHGSLGDLLSYYGGRLDYLGWTENIEGVKVVDVGLVSRVKSLEKMGLSFNGAGAEPLAAPSKNQLGKVIRSKHAHNTKGAEV